MSTAGLKITRRDFLNTVLLASGALLLEWPAPMKLLAREQGWEGFGGIGDYEASHGNTEEIARVWNNLRQGKYRTLSNDVIDSGEIYDLVVVGGGLSGLGAAYEFKNTAGNDQKCLIIENHPIFGGHAKRNEFLVDGYKLTGPQASNAFSVINREGAAENEIFSALNIPRTFAYQELPPEFKQLPFDRTSYGFMLWQDISPSVGFFFDGDMEGSWVVDPWGQKLKKAPFSRRVRRDFITWRETEEQHFRRTDFRQRLDQITYREYLEKKVRLSSEVSDFANPILASALGLGCDAISAYGAYQIGMPGFKGLGRWTGTRRLDETDWHSFPGGNDGFTRYLVKFLIPEAVQGGNTFGEILNRPVDLKALDHPSNKVSMRLGSMAVQVNHSTLPEKSDHVLVTYLRGGNAYRVKARAVVMASAGWSNRHAVTDLPEDYRKAYESFFYSPVLVANVALTNWRFLYNLGLTGCRWFEGFGFSCNIRKPMIVGDYRQPLHPDKPVVLTFYVPLHYPGLPGPEQGTRGREEILSTPFRDYERKIVDQMNRLFGRSGFDPKKDIAGIILNRWVNAYLNPQPGFYFGSDGKPAPRETIRKRFGRIAFGHSELNGHMNWIAAIEEGRSAAKKAMEIL
ncbi:MAG: NAD(P)-binding protein [bacterium]|nr:MAG: NAD(P)-binding protein [bacterium]